MYKPIYENDGKDKAVSPIIATILIVAITVVLAATLYAVISGYGGLIGKSTPQAGITVSTTAGTAIAGTSTTIYTLSVNSVTGTAPNLGDVVVKVTYTTSGGDTSSGTLNDVASGTSVIIGASGSSYTVTQSGGTAGGTLTGSITITITPTSADTAAPASLASISLYDTSTSGTIAIWSS